MKKLDDSLFNMWRCMIALAYVDGKFSKEEKELIMGHLSTLNLSDEQSKTLERDYNTGDIDFDEVYKHVTEYFDKQKLVNAAQILFYADGDYSESEKEAMNKLLGGLVESIDKDKIKFKGQMSDQELEEAIEEDGGAMAGALKALIKKSKLKR